jgi:nitric oxide reductase NorD protein
MAPLKVNLDWEEKLFTAFRGFFRKFGNSSTENSGQRFPFEDGSLSLFASMLAGRRIELIAADKFGGIRGNTILLPEFMNLGHGSKWDQRAWIFRLAVSAGMIRYAHEKKILHNKNLSTTDLFLFSLQAGQVSRDLLRDEFPQISTWEESLDSFQWQNRQQAEKHHSPLDQMLEEFRRLTSDGKKPWEKLSLDHTNLLKDLCAEDLRNSASKPSILWGEFLRLPEPETDHGISVDFQKAETPDGTEIEGKANEDPEFVKLNQQELENQSMIHVFEKVETADDYSGGTRQLDGEDELEEQMEAIKELQMRHVIRGGSDTHAIYKATMRLNAEIPDLESTKSESGLYYDEWDYRKLQYRKNWCNVFPAKIEGGDPEWTQQQLGKYKVLINNLEGRLRKLRLERDRRRALSDGPEIDLDAYLESRVDQIACGYSNDCVYEDLLPRQRDLAVCVLLDVSLSTDSWFEDQHVLDLTRDAVFAFGETLNNLGDNFSIYAFASKTRNRCRVWSVKESEESWGHARHRLGLLEPMGYTRIGPALRHGIMQLSKQPARHRLLLLLSDGKPNDYDRYEGRYGIADVKKATQEADQLGIHVHALAIGPESRTWLPAMVGKGRWHVLTHTRDLLNGLTEIYGKLSAN